MLRCRTLARPWSCRHAGTGSCARRCRGRPPVGLFAAGGLVGLCTLPCSGAIYLGVLALLAREPLATRLPYLVLYNVMFIVPLLALLVFVGNRRVLNRIAHAYLQRRHVVKAVVGVVTIVLGMVILVTA